MTPELVRDCARCAALCCVAHPFASSEDFAFDKSANTRCRHLGDDHRCGIHDSLAERGMRGCATYDCHGAGQRVTSSWRGAGSGASDALLEAFRVVRQLHEWQVVLRAARQLAPQSSTAKLHQLCIDIEQAAATAARGGDVDVELAALRRRMRELFHGLAAALPTRAPSRAAAARSLRVVGC